MFKFFLWAVPFLVASKMMCNGQQSKIISAQAYYTVTMPGIARMDENTGRVINPSPFYNYSIYIESLNSLDIKIDSVKINNFSSKFIFQKSKENKITVGKEKFSRKPIFLETQNSQNSFCMIFLRNEFLPKGFSPGKGFIIYGKLNNKPFQYDIKNETELYIVESQ